MPHPRRGAGYNVWFREEQLAKAQAGEDVDVFEWSLRHWRECLHPFRQTGNKAREQIVGIDLLNLATYLRAWPEAALNKMAIFLCNEGGPLYSKQVLSGRLTKLSISKKKAPIRLRGRTFNTVLEAFGTNPPLLAFFRCLDTN
jgi:hypothetical protein